jgi:hypothetical protein
MNEKSGNFELMEPRSPESLVPDSLVEPWMIAVLVLLVLGIILALLIFRRKAKLVADPHAARRAAHAEAVAALDGIEEIAPREAAVRSSLILRKYLAVVAHDPALFETHEEYLLRHEALKNFSEEARGSANLGFARLAAIKYSPDSPDMDTPQVVAGSRSLLEILQHGLQA